MISGVTMKLNIDEYIINALKEDITSEDVTTNAIMRENVLGKADLICKQSGVLCGLEVFERTFHLLDETSVFETKFKDGDSVEKGELIGTITYRRPAFYRCVGSKTCRDPEYSGKTDTSEGGNPDCFKTLSGKNRAAFL